MDKPNKPLFSFGVITDTHVRSPQGDQSSPFPVNDKANGRATYACNLLAAQQPAFTTHLGDMVHPLPSMSSYDAACEEALRIFSPLKPNLNFVSGNHDVGDKPMPGSPAAIVNDAAMTKYSSWFGQHWYSFDIEKLRIVVINSSLVNTASKAEEEQKAWLKKLLTDSSDNRIILFSHYPLFIHDPDEPEHYDNIANPGRAELLQLISDSAVDLVLSGHVHHFFYNKLGNTQFFALPSTSFTRQDYADLFKAGPANEFGRDDEGKFAVSMVDVYPDDLQLRIINTDGKQSVGEQHVSELTYKTPSLGKKLGVSMRHPWHESIDLPFNGPMEEFTRKRARNDYSLLRLLQMGITQLRVPLQDFVDPRSWQRLSDCADLGFLFTVICLQNDWPRVTNVLKEMSSAIEALEYVLPNEASHWQYPDEINQSNPPIYLGFASSGAHQDTASKPFAHSVSSGISLDELDAMLSWQQSQKHNPAIEGFIVQIPWEASLKDDIETAKKWLAKNQPYRLIINLRIANGNPAEENKDAKRIEERISTAIELTAQIDGLDLHLDTFMSLDRGYCPRMGLIDRLGNLTSVGRLLATNLP